MKTIGLLVTFLLFVWVLPGHAQVLGNINPSSVDIGTLSDDQIEQIYNRIQAEGLSINEAIRLASMQGMSETQTNLLRQRLNDVEDGQVPTMATNVSSIDDSVTESAITDTALIPEEVEEIPSDEDVAGRTGLPVPSNIPPPSKPADEQAALESRAQSTSQAEPSQKIYGHSIFTDQTLEFFTTTDAARAPDWYVLGTGDQIRITIFGVSQTDLLFEISDDGYIQPTGVPRIFLKGLTIAQAKTILIERLKRFYTFKEEEFSLSVKAARTITVNIFGESRKRGGFTISALNTAFNALIAAGGPTEIGSVRAIELLRGEERMMLDVYAFMKNPMVQKDFHLYHNDVLYIPIARKVVSLQGAVKRPMRYELKDEETLKDLIDFAGGLNYNTAQDFVQIQRILDGEPVLLEYDLSDVMNDEKSIDLRDGDIVRVREIGRTLEQYVEIDGSVYFSGRYSLIERPTLMSLIERAAIKPEAKTDQIFIERKQPDQSIRIITVPLKEWINTDQDLDLKKEDRIIIYDQERYRNIESIQVIGQVRSPFERTLPFDERLPLRDALELAGGLQPTAASIGYLQRRDVYNPDKVEVLSINLEEQSEFQLRPGDLLRVYDQQTYTDTEVVQIVGNVRNDFQMTMEFGQTLKLGDAIQMAGGLQPTAASIGYIFRRDLFNPEFITHIPVNVYQDIDVELKPGDQLRIYNQSNYTDPGELSITGAVNNPVNTAFDSSISITDLLKMAEGIQRSAASNRVDVYRKNLSLDKGISYSVTSLTIDDSLRVIAPSTTFRLQPFDQVIVRRIPQYDPDSSVELNGAVKYPGRYPLKSGKVRLSDIIKQAGGLTDLADGNNATLFRSYENTGPVAIDLKKALNSNANQNSHNTVLYDDDVITIMPLNNTVKINLEATNYGEEVNIATLQGPVVSRNSLNIMYKGNRSAKWYIRKFAGGFSEDANKWTVTVTRPNGEVAGTNRRMFLFKDYPNVEPGSTISLRKEVPEPESEKDDIDWDQVQARTLQSVSTILTLLILMDRLGI